ncbi:MAG: hypothetical protein KJ587_05225 [Alphaproteobacteria bacterium]|nr:hypothetical protein [Alphaproteobacteria bacterium]
MQFQFAQNAEKLEYPDRKVVAGVLKRFNTWRYKRSQPSDFALLQDSVAQAVASGNPIPFVLYWGKGLRAQSGANERACLNYLSEMAGRISEVYGPGAQFDILYTDTHATLNGHRPADIEEYRQCLIADCGDDFRVWRLSEVVTASKVADTDVGDVQPVEVEAMIARLVGCAEKWYLGNGHAIDGATRYFWMNMVERIAVERMFPGSVFVTFNGAEMRPLFPERLPVFYMYSVKKGNSVKPWFMDEPDGPSAQSEIAQAVRA